MQTELLHPGRLSADRCYRLQQPPRGPSDHLETSRAPAAGMPSPKSDFAGIRKILQILGLQLPYQHAVMCDQNQLLIDEQASVVEVS